MQNTFIALSNCGLQWHSKEETAKIKWAIAQSEWDIAKDKAVAKFAKAKAVWQLAEASATRRKAKAGGKGGNNGIGGEVGGKGNGGTTPSDNGDVSAGGKGGNNGIGGEVGVPKTPSASPLVGGKGGNNGDIGGKVGGKGEGGTTPSDNGDVGGSGGPGKGYKNLSVSRRNELTGEWIGFKNTWHEQLDMATRTAFDKGYYKGALGIRKFHT